MNLRHLSFSRTFSLLALAAVSAFSAVAQTPATLPDLPATGGMVYVSEDGKPPVQIHASETKFNTHAGGNFARSFVYAGPQHSLEIQGTTSDTQLQSHTPVFYIRVAAGEDPEIFRKRVSLVGIEPEKKTRTVMSFSANIFGGHHKRLTEDVAIIKSDTTSPAWLKVTPAQPLDPNDYAIVYLPSDSFQAPTVAYDFAVAGKRKPRPEAND